MYHSVSEVDRETASHWIADGRFDNEENRSFWGRRRRRTRRWSD